MKLILERFDDLILEHFLILFVLTIYTLFSINLFMALSVSFKLFTKKSIVIRAPLKRNYLVILSSIKLLNQKVKIIFLIFVNQSL